MQISESIEIVKPTAIVWLAITGIENSSDWISNIISIEIIEKPKKGVVGLKWKEIRKFCGKEVTEVMWVTDSVEHDYYCSRAESHGSVYTSRISRKESNGVTTLTISFTGEPQTLMARFLSTIMNRFIIKSLGKELRKDLSDIKKHVEQS